MQCSYPDDFVLGAFLGDLHGRLKDKERNIGSLKHRANVAIQYHSQMKAKVDQAKSIDRESVTKAK